MTAMHLLEGLNPAQRDAVLAPEGPVLVVAGPGSGKTRVLTHRVAYLIKDIEVKPYHILAVTFTNKAAREMKERLLGLLEEGFQDLHIGTFHATCVRVLRRDGERIGLRRDFTIYDEDDQLNLVTQTLGDMGLEEREYRATALLNAISRAKGDLIPPSSFPTPTYWHEIAKRVYLRYQELLRANNALDFDDLLVFTVQLFRKDKEALEGYRWRFQQVLVDEFQDTNIAQYELVKLLTQEHRRLFVVGDEDQSIYSWRGADFRNVRRFRAEYPEAKIILLEENYRSTQNILQAAQHVISRNRERVAKRLWTQNPSGLPIALAEAYNEEEEAQSVLGEIERLISQEGYRPGDCAIMYRTNAQSRSLEEAFIRAGMPYHLVGATRFYERREVKDTIAYLRLIRNPYDTLSLLRVINVPRRAIGKKTLQDLASWAKEQNLHLYDALKMVQEDPETLPLDRRSRAGLLKFAMLLNELAEAAERLDLPDLFNFTLERSGYADYLKDGTPEGEERWANVTELLSVAREYQGLPPEEGLALFLEEVALVSDVDDLDERLNAPTFLTLHMAKGLEFPVVFITGLDDGILPHSRSFDDPGAMEEERRLFYVGMTRAKERLYLLYTFRRTLRGDSLLNTPSRFLMDIPQELLAGALERGPKGWIVEETPKVSQKFKPGDRVRHPKFGEGMVIASKLLEDDEEVTVTFVGMPPKRLLVSYAHLERVQNS